MKRVPQTNCEAEVTADGDYGEPILDEITKSWEGFGFFDLIPDYGTHEFDEPSNHYMTGGGQLIGAAAAFLLGVDKAGQTITCGAGDWHISDLMSMVVQAAGLDRRELAGLARILEMASKEMRRRSDYLHGYVAAMNEVKNAQVR